MQRVCPLPAPIALPVPRHWELEFTVIVGETMGRPTGRPVGRPRRTPTGRPRGRPRRTPPPLSTPDGIIDPPPPTAPVLPEWREVPSAEPSEPAEAFDVDDEHRRHDRRALFRAGRALDRGGHPRDRHARTGKLHDREQGDERGHEVLLRAAAGGEAPPVRVTCDAWTHTTRRVRAARDADATGCRASSPASGNRSNAPPAP